MLLGLRTSPEPFVFSTRHLLRHRCYLTARPPHQMSSYHQCVDDKPPKPAESMGPSPCGRTGAVVELVFTLYVGDNSGESSLWLCCSHICMFPAKWADGETQFYLCQLKDPGGLCWPPWPTLWWTLSTFHTGGHSVRSTVKSHGFFFFNVSILLDSVWKYMFRKWSGLKAPALGEKLNWLHTGRSWTGSSGLIH